MSDMLERAARAAAAADATLHNGPDLYEVNPDLYLSLTRAVLMALREPDDAFMLELYPDPKIETADRGRGAGARSRRTGRMQIAHFIDAILNGDA